MPQRAMYVLTVGGTGPTHHHFEADPKFIHTEDMWLQLMKEVADFLKDHGTDVTVVQTKLRDYHNIYTSVAYEQEQQDSEAGGSDDGRSVEPARGDSAAGEPVSAGSPPRSGESDSAGSPAPVAWDNFPQTNGPSPAGSDVDPPGSGGTATEPQPD